MEAVDDFFLAPDTDAGVGKVAGEGDEELLEVLAVALVEGEQEEEEGDRGADDDHEGDDALEEEVAQAGPSNGDYRVDELLEGERSEDLVFGFDVLWNFVLAHIGIILSG